jgi:hypothetical protein
MIHLDVCRDDTQIAVFDISKVVKNDIEIAPEVER